MDSADFKKVISSTEKLDSFLDSNKFEAFEIGCHLLTLLSPEQLEDVPAIYRQMLFEFKSLHEKIHEEIFNVLK